MRLHETAYTLQTIRMLLVLTIVAWSTIADSYPQDSVTETGTNTVRPAITEGPPMISKQGPFSTGDRKNPPQPDQQDNPAFATPDPEVNRREDWENQTCVIDFGSLPHKGTDFSDFVLTGWEIESQLEGDLTGDGSPEIVLKLRERAPDCYRALLILHRDGKNLRRIAVGPQAMPCPSCGGAFWGTEPMPVKLSIKNGILLIDYQSGSRHLRAITQRFRYEANSKRFRLIGLDESMSDRTNGQWYRRSTNLLTGEAIESRGKADAQTGKELPGSSNRQKGRRTAQYLEDINCDNFGNLQMSPEL